VDDGNIVVIGGVIKNRDTYTRSATPGVHRIPILGRLFKSETDEVRRTELFDLHQSKNCGTHEKPRVNTTFAYGAKGPPTKGNQCECGVCVRGMGSKGGNIEDAGECSASKILFSMGPDLFDFRAEWMFHAEIRLQPGFCPHPKGCQTLPEGGPVRRETGIRSL